MLTSLLVAIATPHPRILIAKNASFHREAIPPEIPKFGIDSAARSRLPTPRPAIVVGYNPQVFTPHYLELQQGIIADPNGEPQDLGNISQTTPGIFWPFLIIDVDEKSMLAARNSCAGAAATCNNALMILAGALVEPGQHKYDEAFIQSLSRGVHSFSISVSGKTAYLMSHNSEACVAEAVGTVRSYNLDLENEFQALGHRIRSILIWAQKARLQSIMGLLDRFDRRVNFVDMSKAQETVSRLPLELEDSVSAATESRQRKSVFKSAISSSMPAWSRVEV